MSSLPNKGVRVFISYAREDEKLKTEFLTFLNQLKREKIIDYWHDSQILAGTPWNDEIDEQLNSADVILLLVSANLMSSQFAYANEIQRALDRHEAKEALVIPIILQPSNWEKTPIGKLQALPRGGKAVTSWTNRAQPFKEIVDEIRDAIKALPSRPIAQKAASSTSPKPQKNHGSRLRVLVYKDHDDVGMSRLIERAQKQIDILQVYIPVIDMIKPKLHTALVHGCKIRILVLRPDSRHFRDRLSHLARPLFEPENAAELSFNLLKELAQEAEALAKKHDFTGGSLEIKAYDFIPYFPYYRVDNHLYIGFFFKDGSFLSPQIQFKVDELESAENPFPKILAHFEEFWEREGNKDLRELGDFKDLIKQQ